MTKQRILKCLQQRCDWIQWTNFRNCNFFLITQYYLLFGQNWEQTCVVDPCRSIPIRLRRIQPVMPEPTFYPPPSPKSYPPQSTEILITTTKTGIKEGTTQTDKTWSTTPPNGIDRSWSWMPKRRKRFYLPSGTLRPTQICLSLIFVALVQSVKLPKIPTPTKFYNTWRPFQI